MDNKYSQDVTYYNMDLQCRTCLRVTDNSEALYDNKELISKIESISSIQIIQDQKYPSKICLQCVENVRHCFNFCKVIQKSDEDIKSRLETLQKTNYKCKPSLRDVGLTSEVFLKEEIIENDDEFRQLETLDSDAVSRVLSDTEGGVNEQNYTDHIVKSLSYKIWRCKICKEKFSSRFKLNTHCKTEHKSRGVCNICGAVIRSDNLSKHISAHSEDPVSCDECGKIVKNSQSLRGHKLLHLGTVYTCEICGRTFKVKSEHSRHMKLHSDPDSRKRTCTFCGKKVRDIKKHVQSHTGERPYECEICDKGFCSTYSLKVHLRTHTNEKPYVCEYCSSAFAQKVSLVIHIKNKHEIELATNI